MGELVIGDGESRPGFLRRRDARRAAAAGAGGRGGVEPEGSVRASWSRFQAALGVFGSSCDGDERFTADEPPLFELMMVCGSCLVIDECREYSRLARPVVGVWAGRVFPARERGEAA